ncbi:MAG: LysE family translocator [Anaerolineaceae bacterium]|nr:LysE family translocator [Anaerolineaceae bacterium]
MFETSSFIIFIMAALVLLITPGPAVLFIIARSLKQGRMAGFISALGVGLGSVIHVIFAALGLSTLLVQSALIFGVIKYLGAAYLIYLGIHTLTSKMDTADIKNLQKMSYSQIFRQGFIVNLLNPKVALFFLSFLPQFVDPARGAAAQQIIILGTVFVGMAILSDSMYAVVAGTTRQLFSGNLLVARIQKYLAGTIYIALGFTAIFSGSSQRK